jgi:hypothetical protein
MTVETFNASTTWTCPAGVTSVDVECVGGGGGGRGGTAVTQQPGGGGGAYARSATVTVTPGNNYTITVGGGGAGGTAGGGSGGDGGNTSFNTTTVVAEGGKGGTSGGAGSGGLAANSTGATTTTSGTTGQTGAAGGAGGAAAPPLGGAGGAGPPSGSQNPGVAPGGGGSGGDGSVVGGAGAAGRVVLTYTAVSPPSAPTGLTVGTRTSSSLQLSWTAAAGSPTGYNVRKNGGASTDIGNVLTYTFTGLAANTTYTLEVQAYNAGGSSSWASIGGTTLTVNNDRSLVYHLNRKAATLVNDRPTLDAAGAANVWAGTTGLSLVGALNVKALNTLANYRELSGVANQLAGRTDPSTFTGIDQAASEW